jgi:hypothetical protein
MVKATKVNECKCCGGPVTFYGTCWTDGVGGSGECTVQVCVSCLEGDCKCGGGRLARTPEERHIGCTH